MSRIKSKNTSSELVVRKFLYSKRFRFGINSKLEGKPDIIFPKRKIAVFINGCFWHRHGCDNSVLPKTNRKFWNNKLAGNVRKDKKVQKMLENEGWSVYKIWECELEQKRKKTLNKFIDYIRNKKKI